MSSTTACTDWGWIPKSSRLELEKHKSERALHVSYWREVPTDKDVSDGLDCFIFKRVSCCDREKHMLQHARMQKFSSEIKLSRCPARHELGKLHINSTHTSFWASEVYV